MGALSIWITTDWSTMPHHASFVAEREGVSERGAFSRNVFAVTYHRPSRRGS